MSENGGVGREWNVLAVARQGAVRPALAALSEFGRFRTSPYPRVLTGLIDGRDHSSSAVERAGQNPAVTASVGRMVEFEASVVFPGDDLTETLCEEFAPLAARVCGKSFYLRTRLRGLKGRLEHPAVERALGAFLLERAASEGQPARVTFEDPDLVVAVEVVGRRAGYVFLDRNARSLPLAKLR